ncbi:MAG: signal peptidase II [Proteobacteria bacterium]|nr:signal peptidase II [Pseudomonadota bacterium]
MTREKIMRLLIVSGITVLIDQISKAVIVRFLSYGENINLIPGFFNITYVLNAGGAFGLFAQQSQLVRVMMFLVLSMIAVGFIFYLYHGVPRSHPMLANALALILGGAIGNLIDRIRMGRVVDFLDCYIKHFHWPAFNVADSAICVGVGIFIYHIVFKKMPEEGSHPLF